MCLAWAKKPGQPVFVWLLKELKPSDLLFESRTPAAPAKSPIARALHDAPALRIRVGGKGVIGGLMKFASSPSTPVAKGQLWGMGGGTALFCGCG